MPRITHQSVPLRFLACLAAITVSLGLQAQTYTFTTLAGSTPYSDGLTAAARFYIPSGVAVDSSNNVYVADYFNHIIRKISPVGTNWLVTTLAGSVGNSGTNDGTASAARFNQPTGLAPDTAGNFYVADFMNDTIRKLTPA